METGSDPNVSAGSDPEAVEFAAGPFAQSYEKSAVDLFHALTDEVFRHLPMGFYRNEPTWRMWTMGLLVAAADSLEAVGDLVRSGAEKDTRSLVRSVYEQAVTVSWLLIDPEKNEEALHGNEMKALLRLHNFAAEYGEHILDPSQVLVASSRKGMPPVKVRAQQVEEHWGPVLKPLRDDGLLSLKGLYLTLYQLGSRATHGAPTILDPYLSRTANRVVLDRWTPETKLFDLLAAAVFGAALLVAAERLPWIDGDRVKEIFSSQTLLNYAG